MSETPFKGISWTFGEPSERPDPMRDTYEQLQHAEGLRQQGQIDQAREICESLVKRHPNYFGALYTLGLIYADKQQYPQALGFLVRAVMLNPESWKALTALSAVYLELGASEMAARTLERATLIQSDDPGIFLTLGEIYRQEREYQFARDAYRKAFELDRSLHAAAIGLGSCYMHLGQYTEAAELFEQLIKRGVRSPGVLYELIDLPQSFITVDLHSVLDELLSDENKAVPKFGTSVAFIQASALNRAGRYAEAWRHLVPANQALFRTVERDALELAETQRANLAQLRQKTIKARGDNGKADDTISLFILGPSRSGKTTMESLVGSLAGVKRGYENPSVENAIRRTFQSAGLLTSKLFEVLPPRLDSFCANLYVKELFRRAGPAKVFTNTNPVHIHDVARIAGAFTNTRFIFVKRNLQDNMFRIYMRKYQSGNAYAYNLKSIRDHITWYHEMIDALAEKLPSIVRVIHYEDLVADPIATLRVAAELCALPMPEGPFPAIGDDRGCSEPYSELMAVALAG